MLLLFFTLFSLFLFIFCLLCIFSIHFTYKFDDIPEHLWYNLENLITYLLRYQGQEVRKPMQACLQEDFWPLDAPKTWVSSHFSKKNERITNVFEDCESAKHVAIWYQIGQNTFFHSHCYTFFILSCHKNNIIHIDGSAL